MKLFFALLGVALAAHSSLPIGRPLTPRKEFRFLYEGSILSGLPIPTENSITRLQANVILQTVDDRTALLRIDNFRIASSHSQDNVQFVPLNELEQRDLAREHEALIQLPVKFHFKSGLVSDLQFTSEEQAWSANIKRSIINMLQLNLEKIGRDHEKLIDSDIEKMNDFFTVFEKTIEGDCEVAYTVTSETEKTLVTKSVNFEKCSRRSDIKYNLRFSSECPECEQTKIVVPQTIYNYVLENEMLKETEVRSLYTVTLKDESVMKTEVRARLTLIKTTDISREIETPRGDKQELLYSTEWEEMTEQFFKNGDAVENMPFEDNTDRFVLVKEIVREITRLEENTPETVHLLARLVRVLRMSSKSELKQIRDHLYVKEELKVQSIIENALAIAGTKNTIELLISMFEMELISPIKASVLLKSVQETPYSSEKIVDLVHQFALSDICRRSSILEQSTWLTFGSLVREMAYPSMESHLIKEHSLNIKNKFVHIMEKRLEMADTIYEKVLAIKTLANAAVDVSVSVFEKVIFNKKEHTAVRMEAIDGLRMLSEQMPRKIQRLLMPVYSNRLELPEIRMAALVQLLHSKPSQVLLSQIVVRMERESNKQVAVFTYHMLNTLVQSTNPCHSRISADLTVLLRLTRFQPDQRVLSTFVNMPLFSEYLLSGANVNFASVFGTNSVFPKELMTSLETVFAGNWNKNLVQVGLSQQNIEKLITKLITKFTKMEKDQTLIRGRRVQHSLSLLKDLARKMNIRVRETVSEEPHMMLYFRYKQMDFAVLPMNENILDDLIEKYIVNGRFDMTMIERLFNFKPEFEFTHAAFFLETTKKIPTTLGLPLTISIKVPTVISAKGELSLEKISYGVRARLDTTPSVASTVVYQMRLWTPLFEQGVKLLRTHHINTPVNVQLEVTYRKELEINFVYVVPKQETTLFHITSRPVAFLRFFNMKNINRYVEAEEKTIVLPNWEHISHDVEHKYEIAGLLMVFRGNYFNQWTVQNVIMGEQELALTVRPLDRRVNEIRTRFVVESIKNGRIETPKINQMFETEFETTENDWELRDETVRREHVHKMVREMMLDDGYKHRMSLTVEVSELRTEMELRTECESNLKFCRFMIDARRPAINNGNRDWKLKSLLEVVMPETVSTLTQLKEQKHREIQILFENKWGSEEINELTLKMQLEQDKHQRNLIRLVNKEITGIPAYELLLEAARLNQLKAVAEYELSSVNQIFFTRVFDMLKTYTFWQNQLEQLESEPRRVFFALSVEPTTSRLANLTIQTPTERLRMHNIAMPVVLPTIARLPKNLVLNTLYKRAVCEVKSTRISTFDEMIYRVPLTTCYSVIAKDCSKEPKFAVLVKKISKRGEEKMVKIIKDDIVYEMEIIDGELKMTVNEKTIHQREFAMYNVEKLSDSVFLIDLNDLTVHFDGYTVKVMLSETFKHKQCGLCGHFDNVVRNDFRTSMDEDTNNMEEFHRSFIVKHEDCSMDEELLSEKKNYNIMDNVYDSEDLGFTEKMNKFARVSKKNSVVDENVEYFTEQTEPVEKNRVVEFSHRVCFSMESVMECPKHMISGRATEKKVRFTCLPRHVPEARRLLATVRRQPVTITDLPVSFVENILVPQTCEVY